MTDTTPQKTTGLTTYEAYARERRKKLTGATTERDGKQLTLGLVAAIVVGILLGPIGWLVAWIVVYDYFTGDFSREDKRRAFSNNPLGYERPEYSGYHHGVQQPPTGTAGTDPWVPSGSFVKQPGQPQYPKSPQAGI